MKWLRNFPCAICGSDVIFDDEDETMLCNCGLVKQTCKPIQACLETMFIPLKYGKPCRKKAQK